MIRIKLLSTIVIAGVIVSLAAFPRWSYAGHGGGEGNDQGDFGGYHDNHGHGGGGHGNKHGHGGGDHHRYDHGKHGHGGDYNYYAGSKHHGHDYGAYVQPSYYGGPYFNPDRVTIIRSCYTPEAIDRLPPGLRKHLERTGELPPGLEKKLVINQPLPPEYLSYMVPAPPELVSRLGPLPPDSNLYFYNGDAVLVNPRTMAVMDIVHGVLTLGGY